MVLIDLVSELLYKHNCVIIPDFGGFVGNFKSTDFDTNRLLVFPSRKKVVFNQSLTENDGLLVNSLMAKKGITYEEAEKEVKLFVSFLRDRLAKYKNYEFKNIGSIYLNKEDKLIFVAYDGVNFHKSSYGLQDIKVKRLQTAVAEERNTATRVEKEEVTTTKVVPMPAATSKRNFYIPQIAASVAILLLFSVVLWQLLETSAKQNLAHTPLNIADVTTSESSASLLPDFNLMDDSTPTVVDQDTLSDVVVSETMDYTEITEDVIEESPVVEGNDAVIEQEVLNPIQTEKTEAVVEHIEAPSSVFAKESVYYIAVAKDYTDKVERFKRNKLGSRDYELFEVTLNGTQLLCIEKFISKKDADDYLKIVKRYDDKYAFIYENQE